jgi:outer membrane cobalamin receptor
MYHQKSGRRQPLRAEPGQEVEGMRRGICILLPLVVFVSACGIKPRPATPSQSSGMVITQEEIAASGARTMWEALSRTVRFARFQESGSGTPERIRRRGASSIVLSDDMPIYLDHVQVLDIDLLASMPARDIETIQVLNGLDGTTYYGTNSGDGVILIQTREGERKNR